LNYIIFRAVLLILKAGNLITPIQILINIS
jgi:hypothetical protein